MQLHRAVMREVEAGARLDHPGIMRILDFGAIGATAGGPIWAPQPGSPFVVTEAPEAPTLADVTLPLPWPLVRSIASRLLEALAHAHARGVLVLNLRPEHVVCGPAFAERGDVRLTALTLAHLIDGETAVDVVGRDPGLRGAASPSWIAPEQIYSPNAALGPQTDLYAVGLLVAWLAGGRAPVQASTFAQAARAHLEGVDVDHLRGLLPDGVLAWLQRMTASNAALRFASAALARASLRGQTAVAPVAVTAPWRRMELAQSAASQRLDSARVLPMRTPAFAGRTQQRDVAWSAFDAVVQSGRPRAVVITGPAGSGKSRLASWVAERAVEWTGATRVTALYSVLNGPLDGIASAIARTLRCAHQGPDVIASRCAALLRDAGNNNALDADLLSALVRSGDGGSTPHTGSAERLAIVMTYLRAAAHDGPVVVLLDDVHWSVEGIALAEHLVGRGGPDVPILVILTARTDVARPREHAALDALLTNLAVTPLELGPLEFDDHRSLVAGLLGHGGPLCDRLAEHTRQSPLFAVQLVREWVRAGALAPGIEGLQSTSGNLPALPVNVEEVWHARIAQVLDELGPSAEEAEAARQLIERAAAIGRRIDPEEWRVVCGITADRSSLVDGVLDALVRAGLAVRTDTGWEFIHGQLRSAVAAQARARGTWRRHNIRCAERLGPRAHTSAELVRLATWLHEGGALTEAFDTCLAALTGDERSGASGATVGAIDTAHGLLRQIDPSETSERAAALAVAEARFGRLLCRTVEERLALASRALRIARRSESWSQVAAALQRYAVVLCEQGLLDDARRTIDEAVSMARHAANDEALAEALTLSAWIHEFRGKIDAGLHDGVEGLGWARRSGRPQTAVAALQQVARLLIRAQRPAEARTLLDEAIERCEQNELIVRRAAVQVDLADLERLEGDFAACERNLVAACEIHRALGTHGYVYTLSALLSHRLRQGRWDEARALEQEGISLSRARGHALAQAWIEVVSLGRVAHEGDWPEWDSRLQRSGASLIAVGACDEEVVSHVAKAAEIAYAAQETARAEAAARFAAQYSRASLLSAERRALIETWQRRGVNLGAPETPDTGEGE